MKKIFTLILIFSLLSNLYADMDRNKKKWARSNYAEAEKHLSKEEAILIKKKLDKYDFQDEHEKSVFFLFTPAIKVSLSEVEIKEKGVFLDAVDVMGYLIKNKLIDSEYLKFESYDAIFKLINGNPDQIFDYVLQLDSDKIDYAEKYGDKAREKFDEDYFKSKINTVKKTLKQIIADLPKD
ncbi:exported protein A (plasmid) [Borreliella afzelii ACA-1]|uniref:exported protein A EppA n=1 Tax=Borreliella afzelii TaxID=29518 RepID=UPI00016B2C36|nr:exported protein A [Borreliella afzelii ACA-1]